MQQDAEHSYENYQRSEGDLRLGGNKILWFMVGDKCFQFCTVCVPFSWMV
jgi:hypothetical protein